MSVGADPHSASWPQRDVADCVRLACQSLVQGCPTAQAALQPALNHSSCWRKASTVEILAKHRRFMADQTAGGWPWRQALFTDRSAGTRDEHAP